MMFEGLDFESIEYGDHVLLGTCLEGDVYGGSVVDVMMNRFENDLGRDMYLLYYLFSNGSRKQISLRLFSLDKIVNSLENKLGHLETLQLVDGI